MRRRGWVVGAVAAVAALAVLAGGLVYVADHSVPSPAGAACGAAPGPAIRTTNATGDLGAGFGHGSVQSFGSNATGVVFGGIAAYAQGERPYYSLPALSAYAPQSGIVENLTEEAGPYFAHGGVFPVAWNGSAWLLAGEAASGGTYGGAAITLAVGGIRNLTPLLAPYFGRGGIWIAGWNGSAWLLGGNDSTGAVLVSLEGDAVTELTGLLPQNAPGDWIQMVAWNGSGWLVGGEGIFGAYSAGRFTDLAPASPFGSGGVFGIGWNGTAWLVGGTPAVLAFVHGSTVAPGPTPAASSDGWVNAVVALPDGGWIVAGGLRGASAYAPFAAYVSPGPAPSAVNETDCVAATFAGGWVQYGAGASAYGPNSLLLVGERGTDPSTLASHGAAAVLAVGA